jgi:hypothetical protein
MIQPRVLFFCSIALLSVFLPTAVNAQGNLMITPRRLVFEGQRKSQELNLANTGRDTARFLISMIEIRMKPDGSFEQITAPDSGQFFASPFLRLFPRTVTLGPNEVQTVKVQLTRSSQLTAGEYRSHIYFRAVPAEQPLGEVIPSDSTGFSLRLTPIFGISIPVIVRVGTTAPVVSLSGAALEVLPDQTPLLHLAFNRSGNASVYGDLAIDYIPNQGKTIRVGEVKGIAVYTPTASRQVKIALNKTVDLSKKTGKLRIVYSASSDESKQLQLAATELSLPGIQ